VELGLRKCHLKNPHIRINGTGTVYYYTGIMATVRKGAEVHTKQIRDPSRPGGKFAACVKMSCSASVTRPVFVEVEVY
jgi:hypothetical protein